jgi:predicted transcriptional regulator
MFGWIFGKREDPMEDEIKKSFSGVKQDMDAVGKWIKHLDNQDKQLFDVINSVKLELSSLKDEVESLREGLDVITDSQKNKQLFENLPVLSKQTAVEDVEQSVQTPVQTADLYGFLKSLSANERLIIFTLLNSEMKLSYEDIALLLGKERSTIRGQINAIKQKSEGLIEESVEKNGKKRVFIPLEMKEKLSKYAKVRVSKKKKNEKNEEK